MQFPGTRWIWEAREELPNGKTLEDRILCVVLETGKASGKEQLGSLPYLGDGTSAIELQSCYTYFRQAVLIKSQEIHPFLSLGLNQHREETFH